VLQQGTIPRKNGLADKVARRQNLRKATDNNEDEDDMVFTTNQSNKQGKSSEYICN
jgi:hypothetical protein